MWKANGETCSENDLLSWLGLHIKLLVYRRGFHKYFGTTKISPSFFFHISPEISKGRLKPATRKSSRTPRNAAAPGAAGAALAKVVPPPLKFGMLGS